MSPRTGRPTDDPKHEQYKVRLSCRDVEKLDYCAEIFNLPKAEIIRRGIEKMYAEAQCTKK